MSFQKELENVKFVLKLAVGGGSAPTQVRLERCLLLAAKQLGSEAAKFFNVREFVKLFSLFKRNFSSLRGRERGCFNQFNYNHERGVQKTKNTDRATECAMTNIGTNLLKIPVDWAFQPNNET